MEVDRAREILRSLNLDDEGSFYGPASGPSVGSGLLFRNVTFPLYDTQAGRFRAQSGLVCVLSHECDLDPANDRFLNGMALVCLVLSLEAITAAARDGGFPDDDLGAFLGNVARRRTPRCVYFPPMGDLPHGGLLNLNLIASTAVSELKTANCAGALSEHAYRSVVSALEQHLTRPKSETLPLSDARPTKGRSIIG